MSNNLADPDGRHSDLDVVILRFESGVIGKVLVSHAAAGPQDHSVRSYGGKGVIENNVLFKGANEWSRVIHSPIIFQRPLMANPKPLYGSLYRQLRHNLSAWLVGKSFEALRRLKRDPGQEYGARFYPVRLYEHRLACIVAIQDFVDAIERGRQPICSVDES